MTKKFKQVCKCENCGNGAEMELTCSLVEVEEAEKKAILEVLKHTNNNKSKTAELLDVDRKTLYNKLKTYNIDI